MNIAVIFAGGSGIRMGAGVPKQFLEIEGKPILIHTLRIFEMHHKIDEIYLAVMDEYIPYVWALASEFNITKLKKIVTGGTTAMDSIYNVLKTVREENPEDSIVLIHDGARAFVFEKIIIDGINYAKKYGCAAPKVMPKDTITDRDDDSSQSLHSSYLK